MQILTSAKVVLEVHTLQCCECSSYPEVVEDDPGAEHVSVQSDQVRLQGVDEEPGAVPVDVHAVLLQQLLLVPPALRPVLGQLLHLRTRR